MRHWPGRTVRASASLAVFAAIVALVSWCGPSAHAGGRDLTGLAAPDLHVPYGLNGAAAGAEIEPGRVLVLKFWFTACGPCRASMPEFQRLHDRYAPRGVRFLALATDDRSTVEGFLRSKGYTFPVGVDPQGVTADRFGVFSYPTGYVIGADGRVVSYGRIDAAVLEAALAEADLGRDAPSPAVAAAPREPAPAASPPRAAPRRAPPPAVAARAPAASAPASPRRVAASPPRAAVPGRTLSGADRNVAELGVVPAALSGVVAPARRNDYGEVLRVLSSVRDASPEVAAASERIREVALRRIDNRVRRAQDRWERRDVAGAYTEVAALAHDLRGTERETWAATWLRRLDQTVAVRAMHGRSGAVVARR
jgi:thiol-disulfide isomerase/thioredoxin